MKIRALVISCDERLYACTIEICRQSIAPVFNHLLHSFIATHVRAVHKLLQVCEQVKIAWSQVRTVGRMGKKTSQAKPLRKCYAQTVFTCWTTL
jgi:hypothetical protein